MKLTRKNSSAMVFVVIMVISIATMCILISISVNLASAQTDSRGLVNVSISQVGVRAFNSAAEFGPVTIGRASINNTGPTKTIHFSEPIMAGRKDVDLKSSMTLLSNKIQPTKNINYVGVSFKTISINNSKDNHAGIVWNDGNKEYYAFLRPDRLSVYTPDRGEIASAPAVHPIGKWDMLRVAYIGDSVHIFLNNLDKIQFRASITTTKTSSSNELKSTTTNTTTSNGCISGLGFILPCK